MLIVRVMGAIKILSEFGVIHIVDERGCSFKSTNNIRLYQTVIEIDPRYFPCCVYGVLLNDEAVLVVGGTGGTTGINEQSAFVLNSKLYLAIGDSVVCLNLGSRALDWVLAVDSSTCFGVYFELTRRVLISHGELTVARLDAAGEIIWSSGGADIFTEGFELEDEFIKVVDFNNRMYRFSYETGAAL